ncbi:MAG: G5 domain-containing protein [Clostridia bacterium]
MKEEHSQVLRKSVIAITLILMVATLGLISMATQIKRVSLNYFGSVKNVNTVASTVESFLLENNVYVSNDVEVYPSLDSKIQKGMEIKVYTNKQLAKLDLNTLQSEYIPIVAMIEEVVESIPFKEEKTENATINRGTAMVVKEGLEGQRSTKYLVKYENDKEIYRAQLSTNILSDAQNKVVEVGTKLAPVASRSSVVTSIGAIQVDSGFREYKIKLPVEQQRFAYNLCKQYGIQYELFLAVMYKESGFNQYALGGGNSYGLCQIHISNHANLRKKLGVTDFYNPYDNMTAGAYLLSAYFNSARKMVSGDASVEAYALNSYNMGEGTFYNLCFSKGILNRGYSNTISNYRDRLISNGSI